MAADGGRSRWTTASSFASNRARKSGSTSLIRPTPANSHRRTRRKEDAEHYLKTARPSAGPALRRAQALGPRRLAGDGRRRQGRHDQARVQRRQPARRRRRQLQAADPARTLARLSLARPRPSAESRPDRHLQPLALRGRAGHACPQARRQENLRPPLRAYPRFRGAARANREPRSSNSSSTSARRSSSLVSPSAWTTRGATGRSANRTIQSANCGTTTSTPIEDAITRDQHGARAMVCDPLEPQVVSQSRGVADHC